LYSANTLRLGLELVRAYMPDLILLDIGELLRAVKEVLQEGVAIQRSR
jgi:predicted RecB family endonuclease